MLLPDLGRIALFSLNLFVIESVVHSLSFYCRPFAASSSSAVGAGGGAKEHRFNPYEFNGGTALGISGDDFAVIAADTRLMEGYSILSRDVSKIKQL